MLKLALLQCDVKNGDFFGNAAKLLDFCRKVPEADLCVAPREALGGPNAAPDFGAAPEAVGRVADGLPENQALVCGLPQGGHILVRRHGIAEAAPIFAVGGTRIGINLAPEDCEDISLNINTVSRPFISNSRKELEMGLSEAARLASVWSAFVNLAGGYGQHIYNGQSVVFAPDGSLAARANAFAEDILRFDLGSSQNGRLAPLCASIEEAWWLALTLGLKDFMRKNGCKKALLGLSGGMDSALVACIAASALGPGNVTGILMPSRYTSAASINDAMELAANLGIAAHSISIEPMFSVCLESLAPILDCVGQTPGNLMAENLQARIRGMTLMAIANASGAFVLNTGNKSEAAMGYCTLYGDTVGAIAVIGDLFKTQVYALAKWHCENAGRQLIPQNVFERSPSAELAFGQKDTDSLPPYDVLDPDLMKIMACSHDPENPALRAIRARVQANAFKRRQSPPALLVSGLQPCQEG